MTNTASKTESKRMKLDRLSKDYIINAIDGDGYDLPSDSFITTEGKLRFLWETFNKEYGHMIERVGQQNAMKEWIMGLPSAFNIDFENYKIILIAQKWGSLPEVFTDKQAEKILENWFNLIACKTCQLFRKYKVS